MPGKPARLALAVAATLTGLAAMSTVAASTATAATTPVPIPYPMAHAVPGLSSAGQMVWANNHLFVSSGTGGQTVTVLSSTGQVVRTVSESGNQVAGMVASPDGSTVYVALTTLGEIGVIDTTSLTQTKTFTVGSCPTDLAIASGRLFYSYDCESSDTAGVSSIDPASGGTPVPVETGDTGVPLISGAGSVLAVAAYRTLETYSAATDGGTTLTATNGTTLETGPQEIALTPDGHTVLTAGPDGLQSFDTATLTTVTSYPDVDSLRAVAVDPSGTHVAGGFFSYTTTVNLYAESNQAIDWSRFTVGTNPAQWKPNVSLDQVEPGTLTFSSDGSRVYGLVQRENLGGLYLFASSLAPTSTRISVKAPNVKPGKALTATSVVTGAPRATIDYGLTNATYPNKSEGSATSTSSGIAFKSFHAASNGTIRATFLGSATQLPSTATSRFTVGSITRSRLVGYYKKHRGVAYYRSYKKVTVLFKTTPVEQQRAGTAWIEQKRGKHWYVVNHINGYENQYGAKVIFKGNPGTLELRVKFKAKSDSFSRGSTVMSKPFAVLPDRIKL